MRKKYMNGSFTVEASLLMTVLIPLLVALIYLGFYQHDKVWIENRVRILAVESALDPDGEYSPDWRGVLACSHVSGGAERRRNKVIAEGKATFVVPGFAAPFFLKEKMEIDSKAELSVKSAKKEIQKYRNLQKAREE